MAPFLLHILRLAATFATTLAALCMVRLLRGMARNVEDKAGQKHKYYPVAATFLHQLLNMDKLYDYHLGLSRRFKTFRVLNPGHDEIFTVDPANVEYFLRTNAANYGKGTHNYEKLKDLFGDGIFSVDGDMWRHQRKFVSLEFSSKMIRTSSSSIFKASAAKLANLISAAAASRDAIEIQDLFMKSTMDAVFEIMAGVNLDCIRGSSPDGLAFSKAFDDSTSQIQWRFLDPFWKVKRFLNIGIEAKLKANVSVVDNFVYKLIEAKSVKVLASSENGYKEGGEGDQGEEGRVDMVSRLLGAMVGGDMETPPLAGAAAGQQVYLRDVVLNFLVAGKDTTGGTLAWFFYLLCRYPAVEERLVHEITDVTKKVQQTFEDFAEGLTDEAIEGMHYLHAALSETLRLYPVVPLNSKVCFSDDTFPDGYSVRKGDIVDYQPYCMGRSEVLWGKDAAIFRPERWLDDEGRFRPESPFKFTSFQAGPRICMGKEFAYRQMKIYSAVLLNFFRFELRDDDKIPQYKITLTLHIEDGLHLYVYRR